MSLASISKCRVLNIDEWCFGTMCHWLAVSTASRECLKDVALVSRSIRTRHWSFISRVRFKIEFLLIMIHLLLPHPSSSWVVWDTVFVCCTTIFFSTQLNWPGRCASGRDQCTTPFPSPLRMSFLDLSRSPPRHLLFLFFFFGFVRSLKKPDRLTTLFAVLISDSSGQLQIRRHEKQLQAQCVTSKQHARTT